MAANEECSMDTRLKKIIIIKPMTPSQFAYIRANSRTISPEPGTSTNPYQESRVIVNQTFLSANDREWPLMENVILIQSLIRAYSRQFADKLPDARYSD